MKTLRLALIGRGFMGRAHSNAFRQVRNFFDVPFDLRLQVICARDRAAVEQSAARWGWEETAADWRQLVERRDIDVIDIATPNHLHAPMAMAAAAAGKIVLCEKPLAVSAEEAARMAEAARAMPSMVWFNYRRVPAVAYARQLIDEGAIGDVYHYRACYLQEWGRDVANHATWKMQKSTAGSGVLGDLLSHIVDLALYLNGPVREVSAMMHTFVPGRDIDDATLLLARFTNGSIGTFEATRFAVGCRNHNRFEIHGSRGMLRFNLENLNHLEFVDATEPKRRQGPRNLLVTGPEQPYASNYWKPGHPIGYEHTFIGAFGDFLASLAAETPYHPNFDDGLRVQQVLSAVERSAVERRWVAVD